MASRQNLFGREGGYGRGPLSKVYGKARKLAAANRGAGTPGAQPKQTDTQRRMAKLDAANQRRDARAAGEPIDEGGGRSPFGRIKSAARRRGGLMSQLKKGAGRLAGQTGEMSAPGQEDLTGGGPPVTPAVMPGIGAKLAAGIKARQAPPTPDISLNRMPRKRRAAGAMVSRRQPVIDHSAIAPAAQLAPQLPGAAAGTPVQPPQTDAANIGVSEAANIPTANAPGARSVRSRGLNRRV